MGAWGRNMGGIKPRWLFGKAALPACMILTAGAAHARAGDPVPVPGTYWVWHSKHREAHASKVRFTVFPNCAQCGDKVRFQPAEERKGLLTEWLRRDPDFKTALMHKRVRRPKKAK